MKSLKFRIKTAVGIALMILSLIAVFFWESEGRERLMMTPVLVTARDIAAGELILEEDLAVVNVPDSAVISGAFFPKDAPSAAGRTAAAFIAAGQQLAAPMLSDESELLGPGETVFCLESVWIFSRPASLCSGDMLRIYAYDGSDLGSYRAAYLRNDREQPINAPKRGETMLGRSSDGVIEDIEIVCRADDYFAILAKVAEHEEKTLAGGSYVSEDVRRCLIVVADAEEQP